MVGRNKVKILFILVCFLSTFSFSQDKQLREKILAAYQSGKKQGLLDFVTKQNDKISNKFIVDFAESGVKERKEEWLKICEILAEEIEDEKILAEVQYNMGEYFRLISKKKKALNYYEKVLPIYIKLNDQVGQGTIYHRIGLIHFYSGNKMKAIDFYDRSLAILKKSGKFVAQGNVLFSMGDVYLYTADYSQALKIYERALNIYEKFKLPLSLANVYHRKGIIFSLTGENVKALKMYDKALHFYKEARHSLGQGNVYLSKGDIYFRNGYNLNALEMYNKALYFFEKIGEPIGQGNVYRSKGTIFFRIGDNLKALQMYEKGLFILKLAGDSHGQANLYWRKGDIYLNTGNNLKALRMYDKALTLYEKYGYPLDQAHVYRSKGDFFAFTGDITKSHEMYDKALLFFKKAKNLLGQGNVYRNKGDIYVKIGDNAKALEMYEKALPFFKKEGNLLGQANLYLGKGDIYFNKGNNLDALEMYQKALVFYRKIGAIKEEAYTLHRKSKVLIKQSRKDEALNIVEKAIFILEKVRTQTAFSELKQTFMEKVYEQYEETVLFMLENKHYDKGFKYAESMRARVFLDRMTEGLVRLDKGLTTDLKEKQDNLVAKLSLLSKDIHKIAGQKDKKKLHELKEKYQKVQSEFEELLVKIRLSNPLYASVRYPQPVSARDLQKKILKKGELLVRYFVSTDKIYVFLISKENFKVISLDVKEKEIKKLVKRHLLAVKENISRDMWRLGKTLYKKLFQPVEAELKMNRDIIIIPDGELTKIPFESLVIDKKKSGVISFLLEKYHIKYLQSASILSVLRKHYHRDRETKCFVGFGEPVYDYGSFKQSKPEQGTLTRSTGKEGEIREIHRSRYARAGGILDQLPGSGEEVKAIAHIFEKKSQKCRVYLKEQATEEKAKAPGMKDFDFIHFACHGLLNDDFQSLVLSQDIPGSKDDGYFTLNEIMNCDYNAKLVVLSACQTGSGKMYKGEGVTGLTRAVMYAGTPAVVASLWDVDDTATKELMIRFYKNMLEKNLDKAEALRQAKLELLKEEKYSSPLFWSAFVMYGE